MNYMYIFKIKFMAFVGNLNIIYERKRRNLGFDIKIAN